MIEIRHLQYSYRLRDDIDLPALRGISARFHPGESVAIVGTNGSGKSTLALCLNGLLQPTGGQVLVDGLDVSHKADLSGIRRLVGMVFQNPDNQIISTTVEREIAFGLENLAVPTGPLRARVEEILEQFDLLSFRHRPPHLLSGGEKQRLAIAAVLAMSPRYLVLDEPTSLLDPVSCRQVRELIRQLHARGEVTVVHITQFPEEAAQAGRVLVLHAGELVMEGPPEAVFARGRELTDLGLRLPFAMDLADRLRRRGFSLSGPIGDVAELSDRLAALAVKAAGPMPAREERFPGPVMDTEPLPGGRGPLKGGRGPLCDGQERVRTEDLWHRYHPGLPTERLALRGIDLSIGRGQLVGLVGSIGSGKSTLVQHFNGLLRPSRGRVLVDGRVLGSSSKELTAVRRRVGLVFQFPEKQLFEETVFDDVAFGPRNMDLGEGEVNGRVRRALELVGLDADRFAGRSPFDLSGGEQRRVAIAGVLALEPEILILDEPFVGLDPQGCRQILIILRQLNEGGATLVLISHHMDLVASLVDRLVVLRDGRVAADDSPRAIFGDADRAAALGIDLPQAAQLCWQLRRQGWEIESPALSLDEVEEMVVKVLTVE